MTAQWPEVSFWGDDHPVWFWNWAEAMIVQHRECPQCHRHGHFKMANFTPREFHLNLKIRNLGAQNVASTVFTVHSRCQVHRQLQEPAGVSLASSSCLDVLFKLSLRKLQFYFQSLEINI